jgi:hypothetical protein
MLSLPHMQPLFEFLERVKRALGSGYDTPDLDPCILHFRKEIRKPRRD